MSAALLSSSLPGFDCAFLAGNNFSISKDKSRPFGRLLSSTEFVQRLQDGDLFQRTR
jgi:hypothetical protein